jgi:hypothetical protein
MLRSYSDYIRRYVRLDSSLQLPHRPGEHHFVATYLVPRLYSLGGAVPDFINPDGTKDIQGDIVYYIGGQHHFGIEVKFETVRLTKREFNRWVWARDSSKWPNVFIGVGRQGFAIATWTEFQTAYLSAVRERRGLRWSPKRISSGYGPQTRVDGLSKFLPPGTWFPFWDEGTQARRSEAALCRALGRLLKLPSQ